MLKIYPNPASNHIKVTSRDTIDKVVLFSIVGKKVLETNHSNTIDISAINSGIYFLKIYAGNRTITKKIIKK